MPADDASPLEPSPTTRDPGPGDPAPTERPQVVLVVRQRVATPAPIPPEAPAIPEPAPPVAEVTAAPAEAAPRAPRAASKKKGGLRERLDQDRAERHQQRLKLLRRRLPQVALVALLLIGAFFALRAPVLRLLAHRGGPLGRWAVDELADLRDPDSFELYVRQLGESYDTARYNALVAYLGGRAEVGRPGDPEDPGAVAEHIELLTRGLSGDDPVQRRGSLYALWTLKDRAWARDDRLLELCAACLAPEHDVVVRRFAALVLKATPPPAAARQPLIRVALEDPDRLARRAAVEALSMTGDPALESVLLEAARDAAPEVRREAHLALIRIEADVPFSALERIYREDPPAERAEVLGAIARLDDPEVTALLEQGLAEPVIATRLVAVEGLASRAGDTAREALERALRDQQPVVRLAAIEALVERDDASAALPALVRALARHGGFQELLRLHQALKRLTGAEVRGPVDGDEGSWARVIAEWRLRLGGGRPQ